MCWFLGVGVNVSNNQPTTCLNSLLAALQNQPLVDATSNPYVLFTREELLATFLKFFEEYFEKFDKEGFGPFEKAYLSKWLHTYVGGVVLGVAQFFCFFCFFVLFLVYFVLRNESTVV